MRRQTLVICPHTSPSKLHWQTLATVTTCPVCPLSVAFLCFVRRGEPRGTRRGAPGPSRESPWPPAPHPLPLSLPHASQPLAPKIPVTSDRKRGGRARETSRASPGRPGTGRGRSAAASGLALGLDLNPAGSSTPVGPVLGHHLGAGRPGAPSLPLGQVLPPARPPLSSLPPSPPGPVLGPLPARSSGAVAARSSAASPPWRWRRRSKRWARWASTRCTCASCWPCCCR